MRFIGGGEFLPLTGGIITGAVTIRTNDSRQLTLDRPDALSDTNIEFQQGGVGRFLVSSDSVEPNCRIRTTGGADLLTLRTDTGLLGSSLIPLSMLRLAYSSAKNAGVVTILAASTDIAFTGSMTVAGGERILVNANVQLTKGATGGLTTIYIYQQAGTATIVFEDTYVDHGQRFEVAANATPGFAVSGIARVTGAGTLVFAVAGLSAGSNSTVAIGGGQISAEALRA